MNRLSINKIGGDFSNAYSTSGLNVPKYIEWNTNNESNIVIHIDGGITRPVNKSKKNYAWILESSAIVPNIVKWVSNHIEYMEDNFELIFTCDENLLSLSNKIKLVIPNASTWIVDPKIYSKTKLISMVATTKNMCEGHRYRLEILEKYKDKVEWKYIVTKEEGLVDFYFSINMENANYPTYFTEKVTDCFATGTIPIFWGSPTINKHFNEEGIIFLTDDFKVEDLSADLYFSKMEHIKDNLERIINFPVAEDYIFENYLK